jgi:UDP-glucuronate decarboxylase
MTKIVTGGAGFIGSHLCERLLEQGDRVICVDNFSTGSEENIKHLKSNRFQVRQFDITNPYRYKERQKIDEIYNLACPASPVAYQKDPIGTSKTAFLGTLNMLELARHTGARLLQASTSEVYGDPDVHPQTEDYFGNVSCTGTRSCYDEGKRAAESLCMDFQRVYGVCTRIVRIFNTYGQRMQPNDGRVIPAFINQALRNEPITVFGDGVQTRSFCFVEDMASGLLAVMNGDITTPVNVGNPVETTMLGLAKMVINLTKSQSKIVMKPLPEDDPKRRCPDISLIQSRTSWRPYTSLEEGLLKTIEYFKKVSC